MFHIKGTAFIPAVLGALLVGCSDSETEREVQPHKSEVPDKLLIQWEQEKKLEKTAEEDAKKLSDKDLENLLGECKSRIWSEASNKTTNAVTMVESESAAQYILAAGTSSIQPLSKRIENMRYMLSQGHSFYLNTQFAVIKGVPELGPVVKVYYCKLGPGPTIQSIEERLVP